MKLWRILADNLSSALLALFLAVAVWVVAAYEEAPPRTDFFPSTIPVKIVNLGKNLIISNPVQTEVRIKIRALADT